MDTDYSYNYSTLLSNAFRILRSRSYQCLEKYDLIPTHWSLLGIVYASKDGITVSKAALTLGVKLPLVTIMVDYLESKAMLRRIANETDGRSKLLIPTSEGADKIAAIESDLSQTLSPLIDGISTDQLHTFQAVLQKIITNDAAL